MFVNHSPQKLGVALDGAFQLNRQIADFCYGFRGASTLPYDSPGTSSLIGLEVPGESYTWGEC